MAMSYKKTASRYRTEEENVTHEFEIIGYSLKKGIGVHKFLRSSIFTVGGYEWEINFHPDGSTEATKEYVSVFLVLLSKNAQCQARYEIKLLNQNISAEDMIVRREKPRLFKSTDDSKPKFCLRSTLEQDGYIRDDCLKIECTVHVVKKSVLSGVSPNSKIEFPPCDIANDFSKLFDEKDGSDVTFVVAEKSFEAHKIILAARSPVFKALFYGQMKEAGVKHVSNEISDIRPDVFKTLLYFIYTGSLRGMDDIDVDEYRNLIWDILAAADKYAVFRLKLICERILSRDLDMETIADTLVLADKHNCNKLRKVCTDYIASSNDIGSLLTSDGYANLKRSCPVVMCEILEKSNKRRRT